MSNSYNPRNSQWYIEYGKGQATPEFVANSIDGFIPNQHFKVGIEVHERVVGTDAEKSYKTNLAELPSYDSLLELDGNKLKRRLQYRVFERRHGEDKIYFLANKEVAEIILLGARTAVV